MRTPAFLVHQNDYQELWQTRGLIQVGPRLENGPHSLQLTDLSVAGLRRALGQQGLPARGVLIQYTDAYEMRRAPLRGLREWPGPRLLACGDLHHGNDPLNTLFRYFAAEPHDAVLLTFNPVLLPQVRAQLPVPVRCFPPSFFRYPANDHLGNAGGHHLKHPVVEVVVQGHVQHQGVLGVERCGLGSGVGGGVAEWNGLA